jgi:hypothetical protein
MAANIVGKAAVERVREGKKKMCEEEEVEEQKGMVGTRWAC